ncbi:MAG: 3-dehydro-L-gulonate 2-dehydrogenase [Desulfobacterales bacterium]|nr:3-dehydro-L-gulonate 2-dehydrogenase [Desulfobacterales bacterium]
MRSMKRIRFDEIWQELTRILLALGFEDSKAKRCAHIFTENTCDGVASHGLNRFPRFVAEVKSGLVNTQVEPELVRSLGAIEQWDGMRGVGLLNAEKAMMRAIELSRGHGIGCVGLSNTNHWMRGGTYGLQAAAAGCIGICWTNTIALMPPWGSSGRKIGNNPMVVCIPRGDDPVLLDMAMSQFSNGKLEVLRRRGEQLPLAGGYDENGELTTDPNAILESSRALPIGYWKGSGLVLVLDLMASLIAAGDSTREISQREEETGVSQVFVAIDLVSRMETANVDGKVNAIIADFLSAPPLKGAPKVRYPGQGMFATRRENLKTGIPVEPELWEAIQRL